MSIDMNKARCQSCAMPLQDGGYGTNTDGSPSQEYCKFCYQNGAFTKPDQTLEEMIESSVSFMSQNLGFAEDEARKISQDVIPKLKRWQK